MQYVQLGSTDVNVSRVCLGTVSRSERDEATCLATIDRAADRGCNFLDCANIYRDGLSEQILGKAIRGRRDRFIVTTKVGAAPAEDPSRAGLSKANVFWNVERSLKRLATDYIDLYLCHTPDPNTPIAETIDAMDMLIQQGKVRFAGCSNFESWRVAESLQVSAQQDLTRFVCNQVQYSMLTRRIEAEVMPYCQAHDVSITVYAATAIGLLSGRCRYGQAPPMGTSWQRGPYNYRDALTPAVDQIIAAVIDIAQRYGKTPTQVAMRWCLEHGVTSVITGVDTPDRIDENFDVIDWSLDDRDTEHLDRLTERHDLTIRKDCQDGYQEEA